MNRHGFRSRGFLLLGLAALLAVPVAMAGDEPGDDYAAGDYGRVRYQINGLTIQRADSGLATKADLNSPIFPGDTVLTDLDQRAEIQLGGGTLVWVDRSSDLTFLAMPDPYATIKDNTVLQLAAGALALSAQLSDDEEFRIDTPAATVFLLGDGDFRVEVLSGDLVRVTSRRGVAEVVGAGGSVLVRGGTRTDAYPDSTPSQPEPFNTFTADNFDRWIDEREDQYRYDRYADDDAYDELPDEVRPYYAELSTSGEWRRTDEYGYVWSPSGVARGWRPYRSGYWSYGPGGYFWVSSEPWGWAPYHYGRWAWVGGYGWCWIPGRVFGGAWVAWSWGTTYVGWAPLGYWDWPVYYGPRLYGYYDPYCWSFVAYHDLHYRNHHYYGYRHYYSAAEIGDPLRDHAIVTRPARVAPTKLAESRQARERALDEVRSYRSLAPPDAERTRKFTDAESRFSKSAVTGRSRTGERLGSPERTPAGPSRSTAVPDRRGRAMPSYEPRLSTGKPSRDRRPDVGRVGDPRPAPTDKGDRSEVERRSSDPRAIYQRMATPRTTRERDRSSWGSRRAPEARSPSGRTTTPRAAPRRAPARPKAAPPSRTAPRPKTTTPSRTRPSKPKAAPSRSAPSRPKATPKRSSPSKPSSRSSGRSQKSRKR